MRTRNVTTSRTTAVCYPQSRSAGSRAALGCTTVAWWTAIGCTPQTPRCCWASR
jgi:hypothetical protein